MIRAVTDPAAFVIGYLGIAIGLAVLALFVWELIQLPTRLLFWRLTRQLCPRCRLYPSYRHAEPDGSRLCGFCFDYDKSERRAAERLIAEGYKPKGKSK